MATMIEKLKARRSQYALGRDISTGIEQIECVVRDAVRYTPSAFNSQSSRVVLLFGDHHERFWSIVKSQIGLLIDGDALQKSIRKLDTFAAGAGSVLFFEDQTAIWKLQEQWPPYAENFPVWSEQSSGMAQLSVWVALAEAGLGASLQHYNPLIDDDVRNEWALPENWRLRAQMPFGANLAPFPDKTFMPDEERFRTFG